MSDTAQPNPETPEEARARINAEWVPEFKPGDVVILKEGLSPPMTVEYINPPGDPGGTFVSVVWFDVNDQLQRTQFGIATLELAVPDGPGVMH